MIQLGLLWFDDDGKRTTIQKIEQAIIRYRERTGTLPDVCQMNPAQAAVLESQKKPPAVALPVRIIPDEGLRPNYFLVGTEDELVAARPPWDAALSEQDHALTAKATEARGAAPSRRRTRTQAKAASPEAAAAKPDQVASHRPAAAARTSASRSTTSTATSLPAQTAEARKSSTPHHRQQGHSATRPALRIVQPELPLATEAAVITPSQASKKTSRRPATDSTVLKTDGAATPLVGKSAAPDRRPRAAKRGPTQPHRHAS